MPPSHYSLFNRHLYLLPASQERRKKKEGEGGRGTGGQGDRGTGQGHSFLALVSNSIKSNRLPLPLPCGLSSRRLIGKLWWRGSGERQTVMSFETFYTSLTLLSQQSCPFTAFLTMVRQETGNTTACPPNHFLPCTTLPQLLSGRMLCLGKEREGRTCIA